MAPDDYLTREQAITFLAPVAQLILFRVDAASFPSISMLDEWQQDDTKLQSFVYCNSMGSGGGLLFGNVDREVGLATLADKVPALYLRPKTLLNRLAWFVEPQEDLVRPVPSALLVHARADGRQSQALLDRLIDKLPQGCSLQTRGRHLVVYRKKHRGQVGVSPALRQALQALVLAVRQNVGDRSP